MYHVSAQGVDERMINVRYYYYYVCWFRSILSTASGPLFVDAIRSSQYSRLSTVSDSTEALKTSICFRSHRITIQSLNHCLFQMSNLGRGVVCTSNVAWRLGRPQPWTGVDEQYDPDDICQFWVFEIKDERQYWYWQITCVTNRSIKVNCVVGHLKDHSQTKRGMTLDLTWC